MIAHFRRASLDKSGAVQSSHRITNPPFLAPPHKHTHSPYLAAAVHQLVGAVLYHSMYEHTHTHVHLGVMVAKSSCAVPCRHWRYKPVLMLSFTPSQGMYKHSVYSYTLHCCSLLTQLRCLNIRLQLAQCLSQEGRIRTNRRCSGKAFRKGPSHSGNRWSPCGEHATCQTRPLWLRLHVPVSTSHGRVALR